MAEQDFFWGELQKFTDRIDLLASLPLELFEQDIFYSTNRISDTTDILALFNGIALYAEPGKFSHVLNANDLSQSSNAASELVRPELL